ncbi:MAG: TlpA disulfide reductase family protein [Verrucomicrobiota bacterium JB022]|nr:TlpA disulfide reductase family protein [Verrucomicrobiota bacterium JB022]
MSKRLIPFFLLAAATPAFLVAQDQPTVEALETLREAASNPEGDFMSAYDAAQEAGVAKGELAAARVLYLMRQGDANGLLAMLGDLEAAMDEIEYSPQSSFASRDQLEGLIEALKAFRAYRDSDMEAFETHTKKSFWLWPQWVTSFGIDQIVLQMRFEDIQKAAMENLSIDMSYEVRDLEGNPVSLASLAEGKKAVLLDFWASWCGPCIRLMPELKQRAASLSAQGIYVAGMNTDEEDPLNKAKQTQEQHGMDMPWLVEAEVPELSGELYIDSIPRMVLLSPEGKVLYNGHPMDEALGDALAKLGVTLED